MGHREVQYWTMRLYREIQYSPTIGLSGDMHG